MLMTPFLTIFWRFPTTFQRFSKIFQNCSKGQTNISEHFPNIFQTFSEHFPQIAKDCRRQPKKIRRCFNHTPTNLSVIKGRREKCYQTWYLRMWGYHIFTCDSDISYCFYQFVTTQCTLYHWLLYNKDHYLKSKCQ